MSMIRVIARLFVAAGLLSPSMFALSQNIYSPSEEAPEWIRDLVIYEVAPKGFTSPQGPGSGTFDSLRAKLPYLQGLGVTGLWLSGHSLSDAHQFFNIWNQYAVIEPDRIDPSLGSPEQLKELVREAHRRGIRVFLDVITHGVMPGSSLIKSHPSWFRGGSWGMVDYDWQGGHTDLDEWWVTLWTNYVLEYGVDGFRLDLQVYRPDLWARIRHNAAAAGHPISVFAELSSTIPAVIDFTQTENIIAEKPAPRVPPPFIDDIAKFYTDRFPAAEDGEYSVTLQFMDKSIEIGTTRGGQSMRVAVAGFTTNRLTHQRSVPAGESELHLTVQGVPERPIQNIVVTRLDHRGLPTLRRWVYSTDRALLSDDNPLKMEGSSPVIDLYLSSFHSYSPSVMLSCHDNGTEEGFSRVNPYVAQGSRALFGYAVLFTPMIPIFMSGEEFDATFHPLPELSPDLYGGKDSGKGTWLYGAQLNWSEIGERGHRDMLQDVSRMLTIRRQERAVLEAEVRGGIRPRLVAVRHHSDISVPVPYMRWADDTAIVIAANRNTAQDARITLTVPVELLRNGRTHRYRATNLWTGRPLGVYSEAQMKRLSVTVKRDKVRSGGLAVIKVQALS